MACECKLVTGLTVGGEHQGTVGTKIGDPAVPKLIQVFRCFTAGKQIVMHSASVSSGSSHTTETTDAKVNAYVRRLRNLQKRSSKKLYQTASSAYSEYMEHPVEERNLALKVSIVLGKTMELTKLQSECDKEFKEIVTELRQYLRENGYDQSIADAAEKEYKEEKDAMIKELTNVTYSQVTGKGEGGKWLQEHADMGQ